MLLTALIIAENVISEQKINRATELTETFSSMQEQVVLLNESYLQVP